MDPSTDLPPPPRGERLRFVVVDKAQESRAFVLSPKIWAHYVHYLGHGSARCTAVREADGCQFCDTKQPRRWQGYLACLPETREPVFFLVLTPGAGDSIIRSKTYEEGMRGRRIHFRRQTGSKTSNLLVWFDEHVMREPDTLPQDVNPKRYLDQLFQRHERRPA